jgi:hypothetical protein
MHGPGRRALLDRPAVPVASTITTGAAMWTWLAGWVASSVLGAIVLATSGSSTPAPIPVIAVSLMFGWSAYLVAMVVLSRRTGSGSFVRDYGLSARWVDTLGVPVKVLCQLVVVPLVYLPLRAVWPATSEPDRLRDTATSLTDRAEGPAMVALLAVVILVGAPVVEELVYRGLVQRSLAGRFSDLLAWLCTAGLFTLIHFRPVEYLGLAAFALIVGAAALLTGRLGPAIAIHVGFTATGLLLAFR